jgi:hypothetical protein
MAEEKGYGLLGGLLMALHPDARGVISFMLTFATLGILFYAFVSAPAFVKKLTQGGPETCWELTEVHSTPVKFNKCTGDLLPVDLKAIPAETKKAAEAPEPAKPPQH